MKNCLKARWKNRFDDINMIEIADKFANLKPNERRIIIALYKVGEIKNFTDLTKDINKNDYEITNIRKIAIGLEAKGIIEIIKGENNHIKSIRLTENWIDRI